MEAAMIGTRSSAALRLKTEPEVEVSTSAPSLARLYLEMAERHRQRGDSPKLIAALVRAAWRLRFGG
jgi:hypothetical protein